MLVYILGFVSGVVGASVALWLMARRNQAEILRSEERVKEIERILVEKQKQTEAELRASIR